MNEERVLKKLATAARADGPGRIAGADAVLDRLAGRGAPQGVLVWAYTAATSAAAAVLTLLAVRAWTAQEDVFAEFLDSMLAVMR